jgi:hypothetical protein
MSMIGRFVEFDKVMSSNETRATKQIERGYRWQWQLRQDRAFRARGESAIAKLFPHFEKIAKIALAFYMFSNEHKTQKFDFSLLKVKKITVDSFPGSAGERVYEGSVAPISLGCFLKALSINC